MLSSTPLNFVRIPVSDEGSLMTKLKPGLARPATRQVSIGGCFKDSASNEKQKTPEKLLGLVEFLFYRRTLTLKNKGLASLGERERL
jgi:hypothetical protein